MMQELEPAVPLRAAAPRGGAWRRLRQFLADRLEVLIGSGAVIAFLLAWEEISRAGIVPPLFISSPTRIWNAAAAMFADGSIWVDLKVSGIEFALGYGLAVASGIAGGILVGWYRLLNAMFHPFILAFNAMPRVALMSLIIIWLGIGISSKVALVFLGAFFPVLFNTEVAMRTLDHGLVKAARSFGANDWQLFTTIALPSAVPYVLTGLRLAIGRGLIGIVVGELYAAVAGIGYLISVAGASFQTDKVFVGVMILAVVAIFFDVTLRSAARRFEAWRPDHR